MKRKYNLPIGEQTAERIKIAIGNAYPSDEVLTMDVKGRDMVAGIPRTSSSTPTRSATRSPSRSTPSSRRCRSRSSARPPELAADIVDKGIVLTGGGALLKNLDVLLREETGLPVFLADDPLTSVVIGAGKALEELDILRQVCSPA